MEGMTNMNGMNGMDMNGMKQHSAYSEIRVTPNFWRAYRDLWEANVSTSDMVTVVSKMRAGGNELNPDSLRRYVDNAIYRRHAPKDFITWWKTERVQRTRGRFYMGTCPKWGVNVTSERGRKGEEWRNIYSPTTQATVNVNPNSAVGRLLGASQEKEEEVRNHGQRESTEEETFAVLVTRIGTRKARALLDDLEIHAGQLARERAGK